MKKKEIIYKNSIQKKHLNLNLNKRLNKDYSTVFKGILKNLDISLNTLHILSDKFHYNFIKTDINKFKKFQRIVIIGMGGSILGSQAIYYFFKKKN